MSSRAKILLIVGGAIAAFVALIVVFFVSIWSLTSGPADAATSFLDQIARGDISGAYADAHPQLQQATDEAQFTRYMQVKGITNYQEVFWSSRNISGNRADLKGKVQTASQQFQAEMVLLKDGDRWRVAWFAVK